MLRLSRIAILFAIGLIGVAQATALVPNWTTAGGLAVTGPARGNAAPVDAIAPAPLAPHQVIIDVPLGASIQAAIDTAPDGATIRLAAGVYNEAVVLSKNGLTLQGAGFEATIIDGTGLAAGQGVVAVAVDNLTIEDLAVRGFSVDAILLGDSQTPGSGGAGHVIRSTHVSGAAGYGIGTFEASDLTIEGNTATDNGFGIYVGRSENCDCDVVSNRVTGNRSLGILIALAGDVRVHDNDVTEQNAGIFLLMGRAGIQLTANRIEGNGQGIQIGATNGVVVYANTITNNNLDSSEPDDHPGGFGIDLWGAGGTRIHSNTILNHGAAGIRLKSQTDWLGGTHSRDNRLCGNTQFGNAADVVDEGTGAPNYLECISLPLLANGAVVGGGTP